MSELKRCPFCGGKGVLQEHRFQGYKPNLYGVVCLNCSAQTNQFFSHEKIAIRAWNRRADEQK